MDILIKSFNRPYYLDRCLFSIHKFVSGDYNVIVLDDGTPEKYLHKIQQKYPNITIRRSENSQKKALAIAENLKLGTEIDGFQIPVSLWIEAAENASEYFVMTEDDVWFTEKINLNDLQAKAEKFQINLLKLGWLGNTKDDIHNYNFSISTDLEAVQPKNLFLANKAIMDAFFNNKYRFYSALYKLKVVDHFTRNKYWALNSILMGLYKKEYWLEIWKGMDGKVDEKKQLINASVFYKKHQKNPNFIARLKQEAMKTTFQSSATNSYHQYGYNFDVNLFNHLINDAWYNENFDVLENFPKDFNIGYFELNIKDKMDVEEFRKWVSHFKNQYQNLGADVD